MPRLRQRGNLSRSTRNARRLAELREPVDLMTYVDQTTRHDKKLAELFTKNIDSQHYLSCPNCRRLVLSNHSSITLCTHCMKDSIKFTAVNNMFPGDVPPELMNLSTIEQMMISRNTTVMQVYQVRASGRPGQYHYTGNIVNVEQDITKIVRVLPTIPKNLNVLLVHREGVSGHPDFRVRRSVVMNALSWLKQNNPFYSDIEISETKVNSLPVDGDVSSQIPYLEAGGISDDIIESDSVTVSAVPIALQRRQQDVILESLDWPQAHSEPINEFRTSGYVAMTFPCLFPYGKADIIDFSREKKVTMREWSEYLIRFDDRRFANDPRFRFHCLNTIQRHEAMAKSAIFAKINDFSGNISQLRDQITRNPSIVTKLLSFGSKIRGTSAYWYQRRNELQAMVNQLGVPTLFLTLSSADLWWPNMARHFGLTSEFISSCTEKQLSAAMQAKLNENPLIADEFFSSRFEEFMKILKKKLSIKDYWMRYEYQHRGSPHVHAIIWLEHAPDVRLFDAATADELLSYKNYYDSLVSAMIPLRNTPAADFHPSRLSATEITMNNDLQLTQLLNRVQRHTKCSVYCLRNNVCRFGFPKDLNNTSKLAKDDKGIWQYTPARNDTLLDEHNTFVAQLWRANTDCKVITSEYAIINYLAKYAAKSEPQSQSFRDLFGDVLNTCEATDTSRKAFSKMLIKIIGQRDITACEVMHLLTSEPLYHTSRQYVKLFLGLTEYSVVRCEESDQILASSLVEHYRKRSEQLTNLTLFEFATRYHIVRNSIAKCRKERILQVIPKVKYGISLEQDEIHCKQQLMLHKSWHEVTDIMTHDSWKQSFNHANLNIWQLADPETVEDDDIDTPELIPSDWMNLAAAMPNQPVIDTDIGYRDLDKNYDWYSTANIYPDIENNLDFLKSAKQTYQHQTKVDSCPNMQLNEDQRKILEHLTRQLNGCEENLSIVQGAAGTGKSFVIREMVKTVESKYGSGSVLLVAYTGVAANNINGQTIHSALHLKLSRNGVMLDLTGESERNFQVEMGKVKVMICDEMSMVGLRLLSVIDQRLRQAFPENQTSEFGGCIVYLFGDFNQLSPVGDVSLLGRPKQTNTADVRGHAMFRRFSTVFELKQIMRQAGPDQQYFRTTLNNIAEGKISETDYDLLKTRFSSNISLLNDFSNDVRLMSTREDIRVYNDQKLRSLHVPAAMINAISNNQTSARCTSDEAQGLCAKLCLAKGCKVMLTQNIWTSEGLCNGSMGVIQDIIYKSEECSNHLEDFPISILVKFDGYTGPTLYDGCVPIQPQIVGFKKGTVSCTRKQFPLVLAYAITIHKSQGMTLQRAVIDIGRSEFSLGITYVGLSRVKSLEGLLIDPPFSKTRLMAINSNKAWSLKRAEIERLHSLAR